LYSVSNTIFNQETLLHIVPLPMCCIAIMRRQIVNATFELTDKLNHSLGLVR